MSFTLINKNLLVLICFFILSSCSTKNVYETINVKTYEAPIVESFEDNKIDVNSKDYTKINYENKVILKKLRNKNFYSKSIITGVNEIFTLNENLELLKFNLESGELIFSKEIEFKNKKNDILVSFNYKTD